MTECEECGERDGTTYALDNPGSQITLCDQCLAQLFGP